MRNPKWNKVPTPWTWFEIVFSVSMASIVLYIAYDIISNIPWK